MTASDINFAIVRPLVVKYARLKNMAVVYACLVVRSYFLAQSEINLAFTGVMQSRANLCELLAIKLSTYFASHSIARAAVLCTAWNPLAGATPQVMQDVRSAIHSELGLETAQTAIEVSADPITFVDSVNMLPDGYCDKSKSFSCLSSHSKRHQ